MLYKVDRDRETYPGTEMSTIHPLGVVRLEETKED